MAKMQDLLRYLDSNKVEYRVMEHSLAYSAHEVAVSTLVPERELAKAILVSVDGRFWMTALRADYRVNTQMIKRAFGSKQVHLAHEEDLESLFPDCQIGAMPPLGNLYGLPVMVDESLAEDEEIVFNACTHTRVIRMKFKDFKELVKPVILQLAESPFKREMEL
ncbi:MAG: YbaK/prolyl-tRNA synthetase associated region [Bacteroidetes bacterium]|nr:YbaK/prolyl-tRNA synthetase associated region [Bacteroidota bacterium]